MITKEEIEAAVKQEKLVKKQFPEFHKMFLLFRELNAEVKNGEFAVCNPRK